MENLVKLLIILLLLTGCNYPLVKTNMYNIEPSIIVMVTEDFGPIRKKYKNKRIQGLTEWKYGRCYIYIPPLRSVYDEKAMCIAGHELWHCIIGHFHKEKEGDSC